MKNKLSPIVYLVVRVYIRRRRGVVIASCCRRWWRRSAAVGCDQIINKRSQVREARVERETIAFVVIACLVLI